MHFIITTAHKKNNLKGPGSNDKLKYINRKNDYIKTINSVIPFKDYFKSITILECASKDIGDINYLKLDKDIKLVISESDNFYDNYGVNEFIHLQNFTNKNFTKDELFIKITGRYLLLDDSFIKDIKTNKNDIIIKQDVEGIWHPTSKGRGVYTFYFAFTKNGINNLMEFFPKSKIPNVDPRWNGLPKNNPKFKKRVAVEWIVKEFVDQNNNCEFYNKPKVGVQTNFSGSGMKKNV